MANIFDIEQRIESLFVSVHKLVPDEYPAGQEWLIDLKCDACNNPMSAGWIDLLRGFMRGLWAASDLIEYDELDRLDELLTKYGFRDQ